MSGSTSTATAATLGSTGETGARSSTFDFDHLVECANALGAENHEQRAEKAGLSIRTYYRLKNGEADLKLSQIKDIATKLGTTSLRLQGVRS